ncbi:MAG: aspartate/glutamate racemase family protein, partial [Ginsengibacter sp.]
MRTSPIGIFDSGYGGLTILKEIRKLLPQYDFIYLGDNARTPYGTRSYETVYQYTKECTQWLFAQGCPLIILACNTASAKALRTIQQNDLPERNDGKNVLGVIRPTAEVIGHFSTTGHIGVVGTKGTIKSESYVIEIEKFFPEATIFQQACPLWVPLIENGEGNSEGAAYFIKKDLKLLLDQS